MTAAAAHVLGSYARTLALWQSLEGAYRDGTYPTWPCRFSILYGPPEPAPELFFVGINPGYDPAHIVDAEIAQWPERNLYREASWPLAASLRRTFRNAGMGALLERSNGSNLNFFKSNAIRRDPLRPNGHYWLDNRLPVRRRLEAFCRGELDGIVAALAPRRIVALGLHAFDRLVSTAGETVYGAGGRRIAAAGAVAGRRVVGMLHPTGARASLADRERIDTFLAAQLG